MVRHVIAIAAVLFFIGCIQRRVSTGQISTDGRELGLHRDLFAYCDNEVGAPEGRMTMRFQITPNSKAPQYGTVTFSGAKENGLDVQLPWSHVVFKASDCTLLEVDVHHNAATDDIREGNAGMLRASCKLPDSSDAFEANVTFEGC